SEIIEYSSGRPVKVDKVSVELTDYMRTDSFDHLLEREVNADLHDRFRSPIDRRCYYACAVVEPRRGHDTPQATLARTNLSSFGFISCELVDRRERILHTARACAMTKAAS